MKEVNFSDNCDLIGGALYNCVPAGVMGVEEMNENEVVIVNGGKAPTGYINGIIPVFEFIRKPF